MKVTGVILAAGKGTRMKSDLPKVLHSVLGKPMISYGQNAIKHLDKKYVVVGHKSDLVINELEPSFKSVLQKEQLGTGHAVVTLLNSEEFNDDDSEYIVIIPGDVPLLIKDDIDLLITQSLEKKAALGIITAEIINPEGYGRIVREEGTIARIVEQADSTEDEQKINEVNSGMYCFNKKFLRDNIANLDSNNEQNEIYLTD